MSTTVTYKGETLTTVTNQTKTLTTQGKYLEDNITLVDITTGGGSGDGYVWQDQDGYVHLSDDGDIPLQTKTVTPTTSAQTITADVGYYGLEEVTVNAMPTGTAGTPTATKGAVSNHAVNVTPSVTNTTGYITGSTKTGTAVSVSASELVSGTKSISANGTGIDVTNYANVDVSVPTSNDFVITASKNNQGNLVIDKTYSEVMSAYSAGKNVVITSEDYPGYSIFVDDDPIDPCFSIQIYDGDPALDTLYMFHCYYPDNTNDTISYQLYNTNSANAVPADVTNGKTFYNRNGYQVGTNSSVDIPIFRATWTPYGTVSGAITCNKTYYQCSSLVNAVENAILAGVIINSFTYQNDTTTYPLFGSYEYIDGQACLVYFSYENYEHSIKYASDGTISVFDANNLE